MKIPVKEVNMYEIEKLYQKILKEVTAAKTSFTLNFSNVEKMDLCGIQMILSLKKYCDEKGIDLKITNIDSKQIENLFKTFTFKDNLNIGI